MEKGKRIIILAAGDFPTADAPRHALREADFVVCCDSAYAEFSESPFRGKPFVVVGDGDSLSPSVRQRLGERYVHITEQDYNDLHKAMLWAYSRFGVATYTIVGATGRREDHTLGNISYLATFAEEYPGCEIEMLTDHGSFVYHTGDVTYASFAGQQVSIFSLTPNEAVSATGLRWPLDGMKIGLWWQATLNTALGNNFTLSTRGRIILFRTYEAKCEVGDD